MDYPEGMKGYCLHDSGSGAFFVVCDVIFNEDLLGNVTDNDKEEESVAPPTPPTVTETTKGFDPLKGLAVIVYFER